MLTTPAATSAEVTTRAKFQLTLADLKEAIPQQQKCFPEYLRPLKRLALTYIVFVTAGVMLWLLFWPSTMLGSAPVPPTPPVPPAPRELWGDVAWQFAPLLPLLCSILIFKIMQRRTLVQTVWKGNPNLQQPREVVSSEEWLRTTSTIVTIEYAWPAFLAAAETRNLFILFLSKSTMEIVPKRGFASEADVQTFRAVMNGKVNTRSVGFPIQPVRVPPVLSSYRPGENASA